jgi:hypothetical protein
MTDTYHFSIDFCKCKNSNVCHNNPPADDPHAANCKCDSCESANYYDAEYEATGPDYYEYDTEPDWFAVPSVCRGCNETDCAANDDDAENITRCINMHFEGSDRMLNANVPHAGICSCDECGERDNEVFYTNYDLCYDCDTKV